MEKQKIYNLLETGPVPSKVHLEPERDTDGCEMGIAQVSGPWRNVPLKRCDPLSENILQSRGLTCFSLNHVVSCPCIYASLFPLSGMNSYFCILTQALFSVWNQFSDFSRTISSSLYEHSASCTFLLALIYIVLKLFVGIPFTCKNFSSWREQSFSFSYLCPLYLSQCWFNSNLYMKCLLNLFQYKISLLQLKFSIAYSNISHIESDMGIFDVIIHIFIWLLEARYTKVAFHLFLNNHII